MTEKPPFFDPKESLQWEVEHPLEDGHDQKKNKAKPHSPTGNLDYELKKGAHPSSEPTNQDDLEALRNAVDTRQSETKGESKPAVEK